MMVTIALQALHRLDGPLYRQAAALLRAAIAGGEAGSELPTEGELAQRFSVSLITIRHALRELEADGLIRKRAAKTAVVADASEHRGVVRPLNSLEDIIAATRGARLEILSYAPRRSAEAAEVFGLAAGTPCHCLRGRLLVREKPLSEVTIFFPPAIGARLARTDFDDVVVFRSVERRLGIRVAGARITVAAELAGARLARTLDYVPGGAILSSRMVYLDAAGKPVELTIARHRADAYRLRYAFAAR
jgi:GntR family transcriptional regulator